MLRGPLSNATRLVDRYLGDEFEAESKGIRERFQKFLDDHAAGAFADLKLEFSEDMRVAEATGAVINVPLSAKLPERIASAAIDRYGDVLAIGNIPPSVHRSSLEALLRDSSEPFLGLHLAEPVYEKSLYRSGFAVFAEGADINTLALKLENILVEGCKVYYSVQKSFTRQIKVLPGQFSEAERMEKDLQQSSGLLEALRARYELAPLPWAEEEDAGKKLDLNLTCLRRVFSVCYYSATSCSDQLDLFKACGDFCLRSATTDPEASFNMVNFDGKIEELMRLYGPPFELATEEQLIESKYVAKLDDSRFRCSVCSKLFKGPEFVIKHVRLKHEEEANNALQQLSLMNLFLARPSHCAFLKAPTQRRESVSAPASSYQQLRERRQPPADADTRPLRRSVKNYTDWDAPAVGEVEINYD